MLRSARFLCLTLTLLVTLLVVTPAAKADGTNLTGMNRFWEMVWSWLPWSGSAPPQKNGPGLDPNGNGLTDGQAQNCPEVGCGWDPDGLQAGDDSDSSPGVVDPNGNSVAGQNQHCQEVGCGWDPNG